MPFFLDYVMTTGAGRRDAPTSDEAIEAYRLIKAAGGSIVGITDYAGSTYQFEDLLWITRPKLDRVPNSRA